MLLAKRMFLVRIAPAQRVEDAEGAEEKEYGTCCQNQGAERLSAALSGRIRGVVYPWG